VQAGDLFETLLKQLQAQLQVLTDKPEETPVTTLRALWFCAAGDAKSVQAAASGQLPELDNEQTKQLIHFIEERLRGVPLAHITKRQHFMGIELLAGPEALVPRKETEILARAALELLHMVDVEQGSPIVKDICTGAGNLAIAYAVHAPNARVYASDLCPNAVTLAKRNAVYVGVEDRVEIREGDLLAPFDEELFLGTVDLLSCNPPYISSAKVDTMHGEIANHEPRLAFDGGPFGIKILQRLIQEAPRFIKPGGWLAFEIGLGQGPAWMQRLNKHKDFCEVRAVEDDEGNIRVLLAKRAEN
jgi:release factor glutamine methyltransferase